jgi:outer membrane protein assembly factor BamB
MNTDQNRAADALDQWWDAWQNGDIADGIPTPDMHLIQEITAMHAHAISTADEQRIWRQTMARIKQRQEQSSGPIDRLLRITIPWPESHWFPAKLQAAAIVAIVIVASLVINLRSGDDRNNPAIFAPGDATPLATPAPQGTPLTGVPMYRGNAARTGEMPGPGPASQPAQLWKFAPIVSSSAPPVVLNNVIYIGVDNGAVRALNATTGGEIWKFDSGTAGRVVPTATDKYVFLTDQSSAVIAVDAATGKELWRHPGSRPNTSPIVFADRVLVDGANGKSFVLDQATGAEVSHFDFASELSRSPAYADGVAFGASESGTLFAVDVTTGSERWHVETSSPEVSTPTVIDGTALVSLWAGDNTGSLVAYDTATGQQAWIYSSPNGMGFSAPSVAGGLVIAGGFDGLVYGIKANDGTLAWSVETGSTLPITSAPGIANGIVYVGNANGQILAMDAASGATQWTAPFSGVAAFGPIVNNGMLWLTTALGEVYAFGTGVPAAATPASPSPSSSPPAGASSASATLLWKVTGSDAGLNTPLSVAVAPTGEVYVVDGFNDRIQIYSADGTFIENWGELGSESGQFQFHTMEVFVYGAVDFDADGNIYVFDAINNRIQKFAPDRTFLKQWGSEGSANGQFKRVSGAVDRAHRLIYAIDYGNNRMEVFDLDGNFLDKWGEFGHRDGQLDRPEGVAVDTAGNVYVIDDSGRPVQEFTATGRFVGYLGDQPAGPAADAHSHVYLSGNDVSVYDTEGTLIQTITDIEGYGGVGYSFINVVQDDGTAYAVTGPGGPGDTDPEHSQLYKIKLPPLPGQ